LTEELAERVRVTENGRPLKISKQRLMLKSLTAKAVKGDTKAASILIGLVAQTVGLHPQDEGRNRLSPDDENILEEWMDHVVASRRSDDGDDDDKEAVRP